MSAAELLREIVRLYAREQRRVAQCGDGTSTVQCHILTELFRDEGLTQQMLAARLGLDKGWISRAVEALVTEACIDRRENPQDRRSALLWLTASGRARAERLEGTLTQHAGQLLEKLPFSCHAQMQESLQMLLHALSGPRKCGIAGSALMLRPAVKGDWAAIARLLHAEKLPLDGAQEHLADFFVGEVEGEVVCTAGLEVYGEHALLRSFTVTSAFRGKGWGGQLLSYVNGHAAMRGITRLYLLTTAAAAYFAEYDFKQVDRSCFPDGLQQSRELQGVCPASATAMVKERGGRDSCFLRQS